MAKSVKELKAKLAAGGLSQQQAEAIRDKIKNLGGKVSLENFGYAAPPGSPGYNAQAYKAATGSTGQTQNVASLTNQAKPIKNPGSVYNADVAAEDAESMKQVQWQNLTPLIRLVLPQLPSMMMERSIMIRSSQRINKRF